MTPLVDVLLALAALVWWTAVLWYGSRFPRIRVTAHSWNLLLTGLLLALVLTEELVMQRWFGGWVGHDAWLAVALVWGGALGVERLVFLWLTRCPRRDREPMPEDTRRT